MPFAQHSVPSAPGAGKSLGTEELNISELLLESSVPAWGVGLLASTYWFGAGPGTGAHGSRPTCTAWAGTKEQALQVKTHQRGGGARGSAGLANGTVALPPFIPLGRRNTGKAGKFLALPLFISCV